MPVSQGQYLKESGSGSFRPARLCSGKSFAHQSLDRGEVSFGKILEAPFAFGEGCLGDGEWLNHRQQMAVVIHQFEFDHAEVAWIAGDRQGGFGLVAVGVDQRLEAEALEPLRDSAAVPAQHLRRILHIETLLPQAIQHGGVPG